LPVNGKVPPFPGIWPAYEARLLLGSTFQNTAPAGLPAGARSSKCKSSLPFRGHPYPTGEMLLAHANGAAGLASARPVR
jgi:hypothetical protein